jgi:hypothetical protein
MNNQAFVYNSMINNVLTEQLIHSRNVGQRFLTRHSNGGWFQRIEENNPYAEVGDTFLVRRLRIDVRGQTYIHDYITTKVNFHNTYNGWVRQTVVYLEHEESPYPYQHDRFHENPADVLNNILQHRDNNQPFHLSSSSLLFHFEP